MLPFIEAVTFRVDSHKVVYSVGNFCQIDKVINE